MKILHVTAMCPLSPNSGIPAVLTQLVDAQNKIDGVEAMVLSLKDDVKAINSSYFYYIGNRNIRDFLKKERIDVAVIHSFFHIEYCKMASALIKEKIPFFIEPHGSFGFNAMKKSHFKKVLTNATIFRSQIKKSKGYIFTNMAEMQDAIYRTKYDLVIPNGIQPAIVSDAASKEASMLKTPIFYFLGRFDVHHKGLDYLFDALDILDQKRIELTVKIYGTGTDEQVQYVNERISKYKHIDVKNCGTIYGDEKKKALETANILLLTSRYEGSPMTILDAMSYGNACLVTPGTNVSEEIVDNKLGWSTMLDAESIADTILQAKKEYAEDGLELSENCKKHVLNNYSWGYIAKLSVDSISKII